MRKCSELISLRVEVFFPIKLLGQIMNVLELR